MRVKWLAGFLIGVMVVLAGCDELPADCFCNQTVQFATEPIKFTEPLYIDVNQNGIHEDEELVDMFPVFDWNQELTVTWEADPNEFADPEHTAYRVLLYQISYEELIDLIETENYEGIFTHQVKVAHHWATNPNGRSFTFGSFGYGEDVCFTCPTFVIVIPETYAQVYDGTTGTYEYVYTEIEGGFSQSSLPFLIENTPR